MWGPTPISGRRLQSLIQGLPLDSAFVRSTDETGQLAVGWTPQVELTAQIVEAIDRHTLTYLRAQGAKAHELPKPYRIPRPTKTKPSKPTRAAISGFFARRGVPIVSRRKKQRSE